MFITMVLLKTLNVRGRLQEFIVNLTELNIYHEVDNPSRHCTFKLICFVELNFRMDI